jgi:hypothetical protein
MRLADEFPVAGPSNVVNTSTDDGVNGTEDHDALRHTYRLHQIGRAKTPLRSAAPTSKRPGSHPLCHRYCVASPGQRELCAGHSRPQRPPDELACAVKAPKDNKHNVVPG